MCVESWGGPASCRYFRPPWAPGASHRATYISLVVISSLLIIVPFKQHENIAQAQAVQENQQQLISYPMYQDVQFGPAVGDENISNAPTQQAIDQQQRYLAYLIQQQQQRLKQQQVSMNPHTSFYSLVNEEPQGVQTNQNLASRPPSYGHTSVERPRLLRANNRLPSAALLPGGDQSRQQHQAVQMWRHKAHGNATPTVLTSMQLPDRAHHYKPPAPSTSIEHHPQVHEIDAHQYQYRPVREQKRQTFSPPLPVAAKPPLAVNLSSLLQPGEVMLSAREVHRPHTNRSPALVRNSTSIVSVREIESLLGRLKPLALSERDKATNLHQLVAGDPSGNANSTSDLGYDEEDQDQDREDESEMIGDNDQRPPELFALTNGGSGSRLTKSRKLPAGSVDQARGLPARARDYKDDEQMASFLQGLKSLGSELLDTDSVGGRETTAASSPDHERFYRHAAAPRASRHRGHATGSQRLPIELLVDHLMAGSRLATRSDSAPPAEMVNPVDDPENHRDHESLPIDYDYGGGGDDDDDDDEDDPLAEEEEAGGDYEDSPEGGGLGANLMESEESARQETRVSVAPDPRGEEAAQADSLSAANSTAGDSWTPLVGVGNGPGDRQRQVGVAKRATSEVDAKSERKRRKRRRRRRRRDRASVMTIGNRNLSRQELIRLIRALNKMANDPRAPSDEREAGRRLLRHLIKLALANFKRQQQVDLSPTHEDRAERTRETNDGKVAMTNERLRESLRSMLIEPNLAASNDGGNSSSSSSKISIRMQPWRLKSPAALSTSRNALDEDEAIREPPRENGDDDDGETTRKKSLSEISDDLERYFDTDFFEDLADKDQKSNSSSGSTSSPGASNSKLTTSRRLRPEAAAVTNSPIVYGKRELEAADEDDVDLDHVRLTSPPPPPRSITTERTALESSKSEMGKSTKRPRRRRRRRRKNRRRRRRGKRPQPKRVAANERERDDDTEDEVTERRQEESKPVRVRARVKKQKPERQWQKKRKMQRDQGEDENESDEEQVAPAEDEKKENEQDDEDGKSSDRKQMETPKQDRGGKSQRRHKSGKRWNPSRDDVPAPIVAARMSKETTAKSRVKLGANKSKVRTTQDKSRPGNKSASPDQVKKVESKKKGNRTRDKKVTPKKLAIGSEKNSAVSN